MFSIYESKKAQKPKNISFDWYVQAIQEGFWQDYVLPVRAICEKHGKDSKEYSHAKQQVPVVTGSCVMKEGNKVEKNIDHLNGFLLLDIDVDLTEEQFYAIREDKHTHVMHNSISGIGYVVFVKIDTSKNWEGLFLSIAQYYLDNFNVSIDISCKNKNRLRFISYDPDLYHNSKSTTYRKVHKKKEPKKQDVDYIFTPSDFDNILSQIKERGIDLCKEDYFRYVQIGMSLANEFGIQGEDAFHLVCSFGTKYNQDNAKRDYKGFCKRANGQSSIGTFYYLCKQEGISIYSEKTQAIINRVKVSKTQGKPTVQSVVKNLKFANDIETTKEDEDLIQKLITSPIDYSKNANSELTEIEQLENFIVDTYAPWEDIVSNQKYINDKIAEDVSVNDIYLSSKKSFDFTVTKGDVETILNSSNVKRVDVLKKFFTENTHNETGFIEKYASLIKPYSDYNLWAFKRWLVGAVHNWMSPREELLVSPLTLVLTGQGHGIGKTSFIRNLLPKELRKYHYEGKIDSAKNDSMFRMACNLVVFDDEFGGKGLKDVKEYKALSDANIIVQRRPYDKMDKYFKRRAGLCGTSNETDILKDVTGNRRIFPIYTEGIDYDAVINFDQVSMIVEAYNLWKSGWDWKVYKKEDIEYLKDNTEDNNEVMPVEEIFFKYFSLIPDEKFKMSVVMNQGEVLDYLTKLTQIRITKFDVKDVFVKNKLNYKAFKVDGKAKKGVQLYRKLTDSDQDNENHDEIPY